MMEGLIRILSRLPLGVLYSIATLLIYPSLYHIARYRRTLARKNLQRSFPNKTPQELKRIEREYYKTLCDTIAEIIWSYRASDAHIREHIIFENKEIIEQYALQNKGVFCMLGHMGNCELMTSLVRQCANPMMYSINVYQEQKNHAADQLMIHLREHIAGPNTCIEKHYLLRHLLQHRDTQPYPCIGLVCDQKPTPVNAHFWTTFLHQDTAFNNGGERIAKKMGYACMYSHIRLVERGKYVVRFHLITDHPQDEPDGYITEQYARLLEANIIEQPALWLWTHNRWKWNRQGEVNG